MTNTPSGIDSFFTAWLAQGCRKCIIKCVSGSSLFPVCAGISIQNKKASVGGNIKDDKRAGPKKIILFALIFRICYDLFDFSLRMHFYAVQERDQCLYVCTVGECSHDDNIFTLHADLDMISCLKCVRHIAGGIRPAVGAEPHSSLDKPAFVGYNKNRKCSQCSLGRQVPSGTFVLCGRAAGHEYGKKGR